MKEENEKAKNQNKEIWTFFDEMNTCLSLLSFLTEIFKDRSFCNDTSKYLLTIKKFFQNEYEFALPFQLNNNFYESQIIKLLSFLRFIFFDVDINDLYNSINYSENIYNEEAPLAFYYITFR